MFDQNVLVTLITITVAILGAVLGVASFIRDARRSRKEDEQQSEHAATQKRQAVALESQTSVLDRQALLMEQSLAKQGEVPVIPEPPPPPDETAIQRWTRSYVTERLTTTLALIRTEIQKEIAPLMTSVDHLGSRLDGLVSLREYMAHQANLYKTVQEGEQIRTQIEENIREYQRQGLDPDEIQRQILTAIGNGLLHMAAVPTPPVPPALAENMQDGQAQADG